MSIRFCPQCGTATLPGARFCAQCGTPLGGVPAAAPPPGQWRLTGLGAGALGFFLMAGLTIWTLILSPAPPRPAPGGGATPGAGPTAAASPATPPKFVELPREVKQFISELQDQAQAKPERAEGWVKLGLVAARASQFDPAYRERALDAFGHALALDPKNTDALRGAANLHYDQNEPREAIPLFERYLALKPDDVSARTDLGTMYHYAGDGPKAIATYRDAIRRDPSFLHARYNLAIAQHRQGDTAAAIAGLREALPLAKDADARRRIEEAIAGFEGVPTPPRDSDHATGTPSPAGTPFQRAVETALRAQAIMGPRIAGFVWQDATTGRVLMENFPMASMPPMVREKFLTRLATELDTAARAHAPDGSPRLEIVDQQTGEVMATVPDPATSK